MITAEILQGHLDAAGVTHFDAREFASRPFPDRYLPNAVAILKVADMLRHWMAEPLLLTSGYRDVETNTHVGGSKGSSHCSAAAVDLRVLRAHLRPEANLRLRRGAALIWIAYPAHVAGLGCYAQNVHLDVHTPNKGRRTWVTTKKPAPSSAIERQRWLMSLRGSTTPEHARRELEVQS